MGHGHAHGVSHDLAESGSAGLRHRRRLMLVVCITGSIFIAQVIGGLISGSLALLADAGHMLTDVTGLVIAMTAIALAARPATAKRTFGLLRLEILAALVNGLLLVAIAVWVLVEAIERWNQPAEIKSGLMLGVAVVGALANVAGLLILRSGKDESLNLRGAYLEVLGDLLGSVAVIVAAIIITFTGYTRADSIASFVIFIMIVPRAVSLIRDVVNVLLETTPEGVDLDDVRTLLLELPEVVDIHDLHAWTITSGVPVMSAHVTLSDDSLAQNTSGPVLDKLTTCVRDHFQVTHCTFQLEPRGHREHESMQHA